MRQNHWIYEGFGSLCCQWVSYTSYTIEWHICVLTTKPIWSQVVQTTSRCVQIVIRCQNTLRIHLPLVLTSCDWITGDACQDRVKIHYITLSFRGKCMHECPVEVLLLVVFFYMLLYFLYCFWLCRQWQPSLWGWHWAGASRAGVGKVSRISLLSCSGNSLFFVIWHPSLTATIFRKFLDS